jgi:hypothetical protein
LTFSNRFKKSQQWILCPQAQEDKVVIVTKHNNPYGWANCMDRLITVVKQTDTVHIVSVGAIVGPAHLV